MAGLWVCFNGRASGACDGLIEAHEKTRMPLKILTQAIGKMELPLGKIMGRAELRGEKGS